LSATEPATPYTWPTPRPAQALALAVPVLLLGGAYVSEYGFGLYPCEMCWWQRYPHFVAAGFGVMGVFLAPQRLWVALSALAMLASGMIGGYHAGVEYGWWQGVTACTNLAASAGGDPLEAIWNAPLIRCDVAPWSLFGISLAGWNFLVSTLAAGLILGILARRPRDV